MQNNAQQNEALSCISYVKQKAIPVLRNGFAYSVNNAPKKKAY